MFAAVISPVSITSKLKVTVLTTDLALSWHMNSFKDTHSEVTVTILGDAKLQWFGSKVCLMHELRGAKPSCCKVMTLWHVSCAPVRCVRSSRVVCNSECCVPGRESRPGPCLFSSREESVKPGQRATAVPRHLSALATGGRPYRAFHGSGAQRLLCCS